MCNCFCSHSRIRQCLRSKRRTDLGLSPKTRMGWSRQGLRWQRRPSAGRDQAPLAIPLHSQCPVLLDPIDNRGVVVVKHAMQKAVSAQMFELIRRNRLLPCTRHSQCRPAWASDCITGTRWRRQRPEILCGSGSRSQLRRWWRSELDWGDSRRCRCRSWR